MARLKFNAIKGLMLFCLLSGIGIKPWAISYAQSSRAGRDDKIISNIPACEDSTRKIKTRRYPTYWGAELSLSVPQSVWISKIPQLDKMNVNYLGTNLGGVLGFPVGKIKASGGLYNSGASVPYDIYMLQGSLSSNIYLFRLRQIKYHLFEPYAVVGVSRQQAKVYGHGLAPVQPKSLQANYSTADCPLAGVMTDTQLNVGAGVEYQIESGRNNFIHFFAEVTYGVPLAWRASNDAFRGTRSLNSACISLGINSGIFK